MIPIPNPAALVKKFIGRGVTLGQELIPRDISAQEFNRLRLVASGHDMRGRKRKEPVDMDKYLKDWSRRRKQKQQ